MQIANETVKEIVPEVIPYLKEGLMLIGGIVTINIPDSDVLSIYLGEWSELIASMFSHVTGMYLIGWAAIGVRNRAKKKGAEKRKIEATTRSIDLSNAIKQKELDKLKE